MSTNFNIAWRFITSRKRSMAMTLCGIVFGVAFFIVTQAQTSGFQSFFVDTILGTSGALKIQDRFQDTLESQVVRSESGVLSDFRIRSNAGRYVQGVEYPDDIREALEQYEEVIGVSEIVEGRGTLSSGIREQSVRIYGIRLADHLSVSNLSEQIVFGDLQEYASDSNAILLGARLAERMNVRIGDTLRIETGEDSRNYRLGAIYETGVSDIDGQNIYMDLTEVRSLLRKPFGEAYLQVEIREPKLAPVLAAQIEQAIGHGVSSWQKREKVWLDVFKALRFSSALTVSTIILISGLGMFNTLAMMVMEKTREIAILRSMGYEREDIARIFLWQGAIILLVGTVLGCLLGALGTWGVSKIPLRIRGIFASDHFVVNWDPWHYVTAAIVASIVVMLASTLPARRAARLEPGNIIRGSAT